MGWAGYWSSARGRYFLTPNFEMANIDLNLIFVICWLLWTIFYCFYHNFGHVTVDQFWLSRASYHIIIISLFSFYTWVWGSTLNSLESRSRFLASKWGCRSALLIKLTASLREVQIESDMAVCDWSSWGPLPASCRLFIGYIYLWRTQMLITWKLSAVRKCSAASLYALRLTQDMPKLYRHLMNPGLCLKI